MPKKRVVLLGSTGSIGQSTLKVVEDLRDRVELVGIAAGGGSLDELARQARTLGVKKVGVFQKSKYADLKRQLNGRIECVCGEEGLIDLATMPEADIVLIAIVGTAGLRPALEAIRAGKDIAIASKEILVMAGESVMEEAAKHKVKVLPVDSEHSAIFQCLENRPKEHVKQLWLTASGGPFRKKPKEEFAAITVQDALKHPTWNMGNKITIDSATLMNKGLEMIEARWLFGMDIEQVKVVIHPQSIIHSMVEFIDGSILAQLSEPNMRYPIQYALTFPDRAPNTMEPFDFGRMNTLTFENPDEERFPALALAREAGRRGGTTPAVFNAANEVAVDRFVKGSLGFPGIWETVARTLAAHRTVAHPSLDVIVEADRWAREEAAKD